MVLGPRVQDLMDRGFLSRVQYYSPKTVTTEGMHTRMGDYVAAEIDQAVNNRGVTGHAVDWYRKACDGAPAIAFCASIAHAENVAEGFRAAGYRWQALHSKASYAENQAAIQKLGNGELHGVSSCDIISEGFDVPVVTAAILLRPTQSLGLHLQQIGRVLRPAPGKDRAIVIDHVGNVAQCRADVWTLNHGRAEDDRHWSLRGATKKEKTERVARCEQCLAIIPPSVTVCPECGHEKKAPERKPLAQVEGDLEELPESLSESDEIPYQQQGIAKKFLDMLRQNPEMDAGDLADDLLPPVPANCHEIRAARENRDNAIGLFCEFKLGGQKKRDWDRFRVQLHAYMQPVNGALCAAAQTLADFQAIAKINGYKPGWAFYRFQKKNQHVRN
jgi:superfamily II DNA or RNA helicase